MALISNIYNYEKILAFFFEKNFSLQKIKNPVFIIGCGRSGTTIFGKTLSYHPDITYLNEPRDIWFSCYPETDIWTSEAEKRKGKLVMTKNNIVEKNSRKLKNSFYREIQKTGRSILVEKLPINSFRLDFLYSIFPDARFIHILRRGIDVALSIEKICKNGGWFVSHPYKWKLLYTYAESMRETTGIAQQCNSYYEKGLLEWRLSIESIFSFKEKMKQDVTFCEIQYEDFIENPEGVVEHIFNFLKIKNNNIVNTFVKSAVWEKNLLKERHIIGEKERHIIGEKILSFFI